MHIVVVANGELAVRHHAMVAAVLDAADHVIAADGGLAHCRAMSRWPDLVVGDLDSVERELIDQAQDRGVEVRRFPTDKDATDLEIALDAACEQGASSITVVAAFAGRLDHELATIALLAAAATTGLEIRAMDGRRDMRVVTDSIELAFPIDAVVSLVPWFGDVLDVTTRGFKWPLHDDILPAGTSRGVSNVVVEDRQQVSITAGVLLVVRDTWP